jgi:Flp pilus assembly protein TadD
LKLADGNAEGAAADFTKALSLSAGLALAYANRGVAHTVQGKDAEAESDFRRALELDPGLRTLIEDRVASIKQQRR